MLAITHTTSKKELLQNLASIATEKTDLIINVQSLPTFLATPIAFTIFNYQISSYPRKIYWNSSIEDILDFLKICQVDVYKPQPQDVQSSVVTVDAILKNTNLDTEINLKPTNNVEYTEVEFFDKKPESEDDFGVSFFSGYKNKISAEDLLKKDRYSPSSLLDRQLPNLDINSKLETNKNDLLLQSYQIDENESNNSTQPRLDFKINTETLGEKRRLPEEKSYESSKTKYNYAEPAYEQNLDNWLEKIEATRAALTGLKQEESKQVKKPNFFVKSFQFSAVLSLLSLFVFGFYIVFPTNVYSVNVTSQKKNTQTTIDLPVSKFLTQSRNFNETGEAPGTGEEIINLSQARGKVLLENKSGGPISFNKNGIILVSSSGGEYRQLSVSTDPSTYVIPGRSNVVGGSVEISIQSVKTGGDFSLTKDSVLKVYNLNRDLLGGLFSGVVTEEIATAKPSGKKVIQSQELKKLQEENLTKLEKKSQEELKLIANETTFTDPKWYSLSNVIDVFTHAAGDVAETVGITTTARSKLYYLNKNLLEDELKNVNSDMNKLNKVASLIYTGDFTRIDSKIQISVDYEYGQKINLDENELADKLNNDNFDKTKSELQNSYPQITEIKKQEQGIRLPGVAARVNVNIDRGE